jgi:hypothetical protein
MLSTAKSGIESIHDLSGLGRLCPLVVGGVWLFLFLWSASFLLEALWFATSDLLVRSFFLDFGGAPFLFLRRLWFGLRYIGFGIRRLVGFGFFFFFVDLGLVSDNLDSESIRRLMGFEFPLFLRGSFLFLERFRLVLWWLLIMNVVLGSFLLSQGFRLIYRCV